jgi:SlyX protein
VSVERRLVELEERAAHSEKLVDELSGVLHRQQQEIDALIREVKALRQQVAILSGSEAGPEKPPHY